MEAFWVRKKSRAFIDFWILVFCIYLSAINSQTNKSWCINYIKPLIHPSTKLSPESLLKLNHVMAQTTWVNNGRPLHASTRCFTAAVKTGTYWEWSVKVSGLPDSSNEPQLSHTSGRMWKNRWYLVIGPPPFFTSKTLQLPTISPALCVYNTG